MIYMYICIICSLTSICLALFSEADGTEDGSTTGNSNPDDGSFLDEVDSGDDENSS